MGATIDLHAQDHAARLTIAHARRRNALTLDMWRALPARLAEAAADPDVRVVLIEGDGSLAFSAGADISEFGSVRSRPEDVEAYEHAVEAALQALAAFPKPTVAAIRGVCFGGGLELALACDLRIAVADARFRMPGARLSLGYAHSAVEMLVNRLGQAATAEILFTAEAFDANAALRLGVIQRAFDAETFEAERDALAATIAANAPLTLLAAKRAMVELAKPVAERDLAAVDTLVAACFASDDYAEGRAAFAERRQPRFTAAAGTAVTERNSTPAPEVTT